MGSASFETEYRSPHRQIAVRWFYLSGVRDPTSQLNHRSPATQHSGRHYIKSVKLRKIYKDISILTSRRTQYEILHPLDLDIPRVLDLVTRSRPYQDAYALIDPN